MAGTKGHSGKGSGGAGRGQGQKRKRVTIERGMVLSLSRVSNDGRHVHPAVEGEVVHVGGESGHDRQFVIVTEKETLTVFVEG